MILLAILVGIRTKAAEMACNYQIILADFSEYGINASDTQCWRGKESLDPFRPLDFEPLPAKRLHDHSV
jgi:hypothetical protein